MKQKRAQGCDMRDVQEVPTSNIQISGVLLYVANDKTFYRGITHLAMSLLTNQIVQRAMYEDNIITYQ